MQGVGVYDARIPVSLVDAVRHWPNVLERARDHYGVPDPLPITMKSFSLTPDTHRVSPDDAYLYSGGGQLSYPLNESYVDCVDAMQRMEIECQSLIPPKEPDPTNLSAMRSPTIQYGDGVSARGFVQHQHDLYVHVLQNNDMDVRRRIRAYHLLRILEIPDEISFANSVALLP